MVKGLIFFFYKLLKLKGQPAYSIYGYNSFQYLNTENYSSEKEKNNAFSKSFFKECLS